MAHTKKEVASKQKRIPYFDALRVLAALAVIMIHVAAKRWVLADVGTSEWQISNIYDGLVRWAVPVFIMISGALLLDPKKQFDTKSFYRKNILRLVTAFVFWSLIYVLFNIFVFKQYSGFSWALRKFVSGEYHMWFIYMLLGLYIATPVLRLITKDKKTTRYFLTIGFLISFGLSGLKMIFEGLWMGTGNTYCNYMAGLVGSVVDLMGFKFAAGFVLYYVLGYYLRSIEINQKKQRIAYVLGIIGAMITVLFTWWVSSSSGEKWDIFVNNSLWVLVQAIAVFIFAKYHMNEIGKNKAIKLFSRLSFGIYLVHILVLNASMTWVLKGVEWNFATIPLIVVGVFALSAAISWLISKIPVLNKYVM